MFLADLDQLLATARRRPRILAQILFAVYALLIASAVFAQGFSYRVDIDAPRQLEELLQNNLDIVRWRDNPRVDLRMLERLVRDATAQVTTLVATEGYYSPRVKATLDTSGERPVARIVVDPGPPVLVGDVDIELRGFVQMDKGKAPYDAAALRNKWALPVGARFRQADWEGAKRALLRQVMEERFPFAQLVESRATVDPESRRALLRLVVDSGPEARFDGLRIVGLQRYPATVITNLNKIKPGDTYNEADMQAFQARLQDTGYFASVEVSADLASVLETELGEMQGKRAPPPPGAAVTLPVVVRVTENKRRRTEVGLGFSTNTGARAQVSYDDLNVLGKRMKSEVVLESLRQTARADFFWPTTPSGYNDSVGGRLERNDLRGEVTRVVSLAAQRAWGTPLLERSLTLELLTEKRTVAGAQLPSTRSTSLPLTYAITRRAVDNLITPTRGTLANLEFGGALLPILTDEQFLRAYGRVVHYRPLGTSSTLVLRAEAGALASESKLGVPSIFLFRAGGDQSVRGYAYQALGVRQGEAIVGGRYLLTGSVEYQYWFRPPWGVAVFYDAGNAADSLRGLKPEVGYGIGARWRSPVGPINVDVAYGQAVREFRLHFSLGMKF